MKAIPTSEARTFESLSYLNAPSGRGEVGAARPCEVPATAFALGDTRGGGGWGSSSIRLRMLFTSTSLSS